ncbi:cell division protein SepF [Salinispora fenicalii]|uniref:cell division protein SepF n=1 Tax=Salinispora fenicalii TaxID=1137263 RepID=UPI0012BC550F
MSDQERPAALVQDEMTLLAYVMICSVFLLALLVAAILMVIARIFIGTRATQIPIKGSSFRPRLRHSDLEQALDQASAFNAYTPGRSSDSYAQWGDIFRYTPEDYEQAIQELPSLCKQSRVLSLDLSHMDRQQAIRLVDFCSGVSHAANGWILRVADRVILLVPDH